MLRQRLFVTYMSISYLTTNGCFDTIVTEMKKVIYTSTAEVVKGLRAERNLSQQELAKRAGMSAAQLCKIERGRNELTASTLRRLADALDVPVSVLLGEGGGEPAATNRSAVGEVLELPVAQEFVSVITPVADAAAVLAEVVDVERELTAEEERLGIERQTALQLVYAYGGDERSAELLARDVRVSLGMGSQPRADLEPVLESAGVRVVMVRRPGTFQSAGFYDVERHRLSIALNSSNTLERNVYRLAYELGGAARFASSGYRTVVDEGAAHRFLRSFAAAFLMPEEAVRSAVARLGVGPRQWTMDALVYVKERFGVSAEAFALRLESLGLIVPSLRQALRDELRARYAAHPRSMEPHPRKGLTRLVILKEIW